jgi:NADH:ubiquinone oxidoreductase subunit 5 (subunit L)/multisubunit Na+/H+ antiporter MnhA subunit
MEKNIIDTNFILALCLLIVVLTISSIVHYKVHDYFSEKRIKRFFEKLSSFKSRSDDGTNNKS